jgi:hypothetical protein
VDIAQFIDAAVFFFVADSFGHCIAGAGLVIPMHYDSGKTGDSAVSTFLKEGGVTKLEAVEKLTLKKKDLEGKEGEIVVLTSQAS